MCRWYCVSGRVGSRLFQEELGCDCVSSHTRVAFVGVGRVGGVVPLAMEGKALASPRGGLGSLVPNESQSTAEPTILRSSTPFILPRPLYPPSLLYLATLFRMPAPQALIYSLTVYPPSTAPAPPSTAPAHPLSSLPLRTSSPAHVILLASHPSGFIPPSL